MNLIISVSIIKEVSSLYGFMYMFTFLVPFSIISTVSVIPVINRQQQVSLNINFNVSTKNTSHGRLHELQGKQL